ncbi:MAG: ABC transporter substrate-binding protein [Rhodospirillales bacterium]|nr:ABC transporter substrate-binding protein [Rhodospirillales bacterium]
MTLSRRTVLVAPALALPAILRVSAAHAAAAVRIGAIFPLTGAMASAGDAIRSGVELLVDLINTANPNLAPIPLMATAGLPRLGGAKVEIVFADGQNSPAVAQSDALRLITQQHVVALTGAYQSGNTLTASAVSERYGIPFVNGESVATNLTTRGYKWFFRTTPIGPDIAKLYLDFLASVQKSGMKTSKIALVHDTSEYGVSVADTIKKAAAERKTPVALDVAYTNGTSDVSAQVLKLKQAAPDAAIFISYTSDAILFMKTMHVQNYKPPILIGDDSGFSDPSFITTVGSLAQGVLDRSAFVPGKPGSNAAKINALYKKKTGRELDDTTARSMTGLLVLCDAINRAGSTKPDAIRAALGATDLMPAQLFIGYKGIKFNAQGQNILASALMVQLDGTEYQAVWPSDQASAKLVLPFKGWT